jgi:fructose/tagatose bisphosphate aldolase
MKISNFKLGLGPMSKDIVNLCLEYSKIHDYPIMLIASRNQVDFDSGYAFTTESFVEYVNNNNFYDPERVLICRDHCGPYFSDLDKNLSLNDAVDRCLKTIETDVKSGFDLIHIDVSRVSQDMQESVATKLFDYALLLNPEIMFEFGSEDNTNIGLDESINNLESQLKFVQKYKDNLKFFVTQTGSLTKHTQVGNFNKLMNIETAKKIHSYELLFKEHNADYILLDEIVLRKITGVDAINIAPQLGSIQSNVMYQVRENVQSKFDQFYNLVISSDYWHRWVTNNDVDDLTKFLVSAHYFFNDPIGIKLLNDLRTNNSIFVDLLRQNIFSVLDEYRIGLCG